MPSTERSGRAPLGSASVNVEPGRTYLFDVLGSDGQRHFGKIRVQGRGTDSQGRNLVVFDWAYQLVAGEPALLMR